MRINSRVVVLTLVLAAAPAAAQGRRTQVPPGHLPPKGMCRVWLDNVPPGQQPAVTNCATAEANRVANSVVIYGDRESFPGKSTGKFKSTSSGDVTRSCARRDALVVDGRVVAVCRDEDRIEKSGKIEAKTNGRRAKVDGKDHAKAAKAKGKAKNP